MVSVDIVVYPLVAAPALADLPDQIIAVGQEIDLTFANTGGRPCSRDRLRRADLRCRPEWRWPVADDGSTCTITGVSDRPPALL